MVFQGKYISIHLSKFLIPVTATIITNVMLNMYVVPKTAIKNAVHAILQNLYDITRINSIVSPHIKKRQSLYHISKNNEDKLNISESTLRRLVMAGEMDAGIIDLPQVVKRRKRKIKTIPKLRNSRKTGHLCSDLKKYISENDVPVVQMDCVEGKKEDSQVLLALCFTQFHMQLVFKLKEHTSKCVKELFDSLEKKLGKELFAICFPLILTDNGYEFSDIDGLENSLFGGKRTRIFSVSQIVQTKKGSVKITISL